MKMLLKLSREALRYKKLYLLAMLGTLGLTAVNLAAPKALSAMTGIVEKGMVESDLTRILHLTLLLVGLYLLRILFRFMSNYLAHKAAWYLVGDLRTKVYDKMERLHLGFFHDKQTGDLMSRVVNDTRDFELLYAHIIPDMITNFVTFTGVLVVLLTIIPKLALITGIPLPERISLYVSPVTADTKSRRALPSSEHRTIHPSEVEEFTVRFAVRCQNMPVSLSVTVKYRV